MNANRNCDYERRTFSAVRQIGQRFGLLALRNEERNNGDDDQWHAGDSEPDPRANIQSRGRSRIVPQRVRFHLSRSVVRSTRATHQSIPKEPSPTYITATVHGIRRRRKRVSAYRTDDA